MDVSPRHHIKRKVHELDIETFTIEPNKMHKVLLGAFSEAGEQPRFRVIYHDHDLESPNVVSYHDTSLPCRGGTYELFRLFQSYSQRAHVITVRFASRDDCNRRVV